ncbi:MAG: ABC transporter substrate-binding protein [Acidimicrobiales bacterium]
MKRPIVRTLAAVLAVAGFLSACSSSPTPTGGSADDTSAGTGKSGDTLRLAYLADMSVPDPDVFYDIEGNAVILSAYEGLVTYEPDGTNIVPLLASSFEASADGLTYTFRLRDGVKFHDGTAMDAAAVKTSFQRRIDVGAAPAYMLAQVAEMTTPDPATFVVTLKQPVAPFLHYMASSWGPKVMSPKALADNAGSDNAQGWAKDHVDGTGPFTLSAFKRGQRYELSRFDGYWGEKAKFAKVDIRIIPEMGTQRLQLQSGDLDLILHSFPVAELASIKNDAKLKIHEFESFLQSLLYINTTKGPLADLSARKAVAGAIERDSLVTEIYGEYGTPAASPYPPGILDPTLAPLTYPEGGKVQGNPSLEFVYSADESGVQRRLAELIQQRLAAAGFKVTIKEVQLPQVYEYAGNLADAPDLLLMTNTPDAAHPDTWGRILWGSKGGLNFLGYSNPAVDALLDQGAATTDKAASEKFYGEAGKLMLEDAPILFLADVKDVMVGRAGLTNLRHVPNYPWTLNLAALERT